MLPVCRNETPNEKIAMITSTTNTLHVRKE